MSHRDQFEQQNDDEYGFWRDEPTSRLERITERLPQIRGRFQRSTKEWEFGWDDEQPLPDQPHPRQRPEPTAPPAADATAPTTRLRRPATRPPTQPSARPATRPPTQPSARPATVALVDPLLRARAATPATPAPTATPARTARPATARPATATTDVDTGFDVNVDGLADPEVPTRHRAPGEPGGGLATLLGQVDPTVRRVAVLAALAALLVPVVSSLGSDGGTASLAPESSTLATGTPAPSTDATPSTLMEIGATVPPALQASTNASADAPAPAAEGDSAPAATTAAPATTLAATENAAPQRLESTEVSCAKEYEVVAGDYWILIAKKASVTVDDMLAANRATVATAIFPGTTICLPANASAPTTTPATTPATPATTTPATAPPTTAKPVPTTTVVPVKTTYTRAEVEAIIRYTWPDELENEAVRIATRESNLTPTAKNWCCYGLFQIYYDVHKGWLAQLGVTSAQQLLDPHINAFVAVALYNRAGGWGPWKL